MNRSFRKMMSEKKILNRPLPSRDIYAQHTILLPLCEIKHAKRITRLHIVPYRGGAADCGQHYGRDSGVIGI